MSRTFPPTVRPAPVSSLRAWQQNSPSRTVGSFSSFPRTWRDRLLNIGLVAALLFPILSLAGCSSTSLNDTAKNGIVIAYNAQVAAGETYNDAKRQEAAASQACTAAAKAKGLPPPTVMAPADWPTAKATCASLGAPIPYDPFALQKAAAPINSLLDAVNAANDLRLKFENSSITADALTSGLVRLAALFIQIEMDLTAANVSVPKSVTDAAATLKAAGAAK